MAIKLHDSFALHPGPWLRRNAIEPHGLSVSAAASHLGVSRAAMSNLLNGHAALSAEMAIRFEKAFALKADVLLRMQTAYDLAGARNHAARIKVDRLSAAA